MRKSVCYLAAAALLGFGGSAFAEIGTIDDVPAATLLLPYFEVDLDDPNGVTTLFSINNASAAAAIAHVTVWTDASVPTLDFDVYLTGYDVQTINLRDIFELGNLPETGDWGVDVGIDSYSPSPPPGVGQSPNTDPYVGPFTPGIPTEFNYSTLLTPGGPCVDSNPYNNPVLSANRRAEMIAAHTGNGTVLFGGAANRCVGFNHGDNVVRGYVTVDSVQTCNLSFPSDFGYQSTIIDERNILWGDYFYVENGNNFAQGETLVHIEACDTTAVPGQGQPVCDGRGAGGLYDTIIGDYSFYGRYFIQAGQDQREPLSTTFATRFLEGGAFDGGTDLIVWRDSKTLPVGPNANWVCGTGPAWYPLSQTQVVAWDEQENPEPRCGTDPGGIISPPDPGTTEVCFPAEANRVSVADGSAIADAIAPSANFGWLYINLNTAIAGVAYPGYDPNIAQAWMTTVMSAEGRFSVGFDAIQLDNANYSDNIIFAEP